MKDIVTVQYQEHERHSYSIGNVRYIVKISVRREKEIYSFCEKR